MMDTRVDGAMCGCSMCMQSANVLNGITDSTRMDYLAFLLKKVEQTSQLYLQSMLFAIDRFQEEAVVTTTHDSRCIGGVTTLGKQQHLASIQSVSA